MSWDSTLRPLDVLAVIMGGGAGTRLFPLTKDRAKPAVPLAGKYRLVDIPISNCLNSDLRRIFLLTQFNSGSLHRHIQESYRFDSFSPGFVEILAAEQRPGRTDWYQGTADAVRQNLMHLNSYPHRLVLILSGDQLFRMDCRALLQQHVASGAEVTVATTPVRADVAGAFGIMEVEEDGRITRFVEKPKDPAVQATLRGYPDAGKKKGPYAEVMKMLERPTRVAHTMSQNRGTKLRASGETRNAVQSEPRQRKACVVLRPR